RREVDVAGEAHTCVRVGHGRVPSLLPAGAFLALKVEVRTEEARPTLGRRVRRSQCLRVTPGLVRSLRSETAVIERPIPVRVVEHDLVRKRPREAGTAQSCETVNGDERRTAVEVVPNLGPPLHVPGEDRVADTVP